MDFNAESASYALALDALRQDPHVDPVAAPGPVVYGTSDYVVAPEENERIAEVVNHFGGGSATVVKVEHMDHNLRIAATPADFYTANENGSKTKYIKARSAMPYRPGCAREQCPDE